MGQEANIHVITTCLCVYSMCLEGNQSKGKFHFFSGNSLTLCLSRAPVVIVCSQTLHQPALMQFSTGLCDVLCLYMCAYACMPLGKGVEGSHVLMGSSCVKTNGHPSPLPPPSYSPSDNFFLCALSSCTDGLVN